MIKCEEKGYGEKHVQNSKEDTKETRSYGSCNEEQDVIKN